MNVIEIKRMSEQLLILVQFYCFHFEDHKVTPHNHFQINRLLTKYFHLDNYWDNFYPFQIFHITNILIVSLIR